MNKPAPNKYRDLPNAHEIREGYYRAADGLRALAAALKASGCLIQSGEVTKALERLDKLGIGEEL